MRSALLGIAAASTLFAGSAQAQGAFDWTGFYLGAHVGGAWGEEDDNLSKAATPGEPSDEELCEAGGGEVILQGELVLCRIVLISADNFDTDGMIGAVMPVITGSLDVSCSDLQATSKHRASRAATPISARSPSFLAMTRA